MMTMMMMCLFCSVPRSLTQSGAYRASEGGVCDYVSALRGLRHLRGGFEE